MSDSVPETLSHSVSSALSEHAANLATAARDLADQAEMMAMQAGSLSALGTGGGGSFLVTGLTVLFGQSSCKTVTGCTQPAGNMRREFPPEHQYFHCF